MKHAGPETFAALAPLLRQLRGVAALLERRPGVFYLGSQAYLHFHDDPAGVFADVKLDLTTFTRVRVSTAAERADFLGRVARSLEARPRREQTRRAPRRGAQ